MLFEYLYRILALFSIIALALIASSFMLMCILIWIAFNRHPNQVIIANKAYTPIDDPRNTGKRSTYNNNGSSISIDRTKLRKFIISSYNNDDIEIICADLEQNMHNEGLTDARINFQDYDGVFEARVYRLIDDLYRRGLVGYLVKEIELTRPGSSAFYQL